jgi:hypothetical protein
MKKYTIHRADGRVDRDIRGHVLIAIEYGEDIDAAADAIIRSVMADLSENPEYAGCGVTAYPPEPWDYARATRYQYTVSGVVMPPNAPKNILVDYGVVEQEVNDTTNWR